MRNCLEASSIAQSLDGDRLTGSLLFPGAHYLGDWAACRNPIARRHG